MKICAVIPTYDNATTIATVVRDVTPFVDTVIVVDDGSAEAARDVARTLDAEKKAVVVFREKNGGKGAAVKSGLKRAQELGFTHALQIDADGQHHVADIPRFLAASADAPDALVLGQPTFDETAPKGRLIGRQFSVVLCAVETASRRVGDPLCGFRVYPVDIALAVRATGDAMDFDPEVAVRIVWAGRPVRHVQTYVRYVSGGVSHYRLGRDTWLIAAMHVRLCFFGFLRLFGWKPWPRS